MPMKVAVALAAASALATTSANAALVFSETFDDGAMRGWVASADEKYAGTWLISGDCVSEDANLLWLSFGVRVPDDEFACACAAREWVA